MANILLSYPRSGSTWLRYCMEVLSKRPTYGQHPNGKKGDAKFDKPMTGDYLSNDPILIKRHMLMDTAINEKVDNLIVLVRDYKEAVVRHNIRHEISLDILEGSARKAERKGKRVDYIGVLEEYDNWSGDRRFMVYYEDLIINPQIVLAKLCEFLGVDSSGVDSFVEELYWHKKKALSIYGQSTTQGENIHHHIDRIPDPVIWDKWMDINHRDIYRKYLKHYKTNAN